VKFAGNTIHFTATGPAGTQGYANVTAPKAAIQNNDELHVFVNRTPINSSAVIVTSDSTNYYIYITFTFHSAVDIDIQLVPTPAPPPTIFGLDPTVFFGATAVVIAIAVAGVVVAIRRKKRRQIR